MTSKFKKLFKDAMVRLMLSIKIVGGEKCQNMCGTGQRGIARYLLGKQMLLKKQ